MSDLQCPATFVLVRPDHRASFDPAQLGGFHYAAVWFTSGELVSRWADRISACLRLAPQQRDASSAEQLRSEINDAADLFRGETVAVIADLDLGLPSAPSHLLAIDIDSDGWRVRSDTHARSISADGD